MVEDSRPFPPGSLPARLNPALRQQLLSLGGIRHYPHGEMLMREAEPYGEVILILDGFVKITANGEENRLAFLVIRSRGDVLGEISAMEQDTHTGTATAAGPVVGRAMSAAAFRGFLEQNPPAAFAVAEMVANKLRNSIRRRVEHVDGSVRGRLARVLIELATLWGRPAARGVQLAVGLSQPELAALVAADERSVNRALAELRNMQVVDVGYRRVIVLDLEGLERVAFGNQDRPDGSGGRP
ncbi:MULTISPECIES: Crp/Fnr family transcriptional regulator [Parafrankia]|uniref:Crp/Fnr family transcriptional regulator n=1 Tax=Parafrankia TaxID=2994362 RepID=UPI00039DC38C|nr:Crp/Fnr family transcriptional regulator [Parafrankia elaeagni]